MPALTTSSPSALQAVRPLRVLFVDDDALQLRALERRLGADGRLEVKTCSNALDAMTQIVALHPDLVVLDVYMPGLDGLEACARIRAHPGMRDVHVVLATAAMNDDLQSAAAMCGALGALAKPLEADALLAAMPRVTTRQQIPLIPAILEVPIANEERPTRGADVLVGMLADAGVEVVFGIPGGAISPIHDALLDTKIRVVTTRHESGAMFAAAAYARQTGKLGVVAVTSGPGVLNCMTGLASAWCDGIPVLVLVGEVPRTAQGKGVLQDGSAHGLNIIEMAKPIAKFASEIPSGTALPHVTRRAIATALSGRRGPVLLTLPMDVTTATVARPVLGGSVALAGMIAPALLDEVGELLAMATRPLILAGNGMRGGPAAARLVAIAERLNCPVVTTPKGKGVFPDDHRLALGVLGMGGHLSAREYVAGGVDVVLAIGTSMGDMATDGFSPALQAKTLIHVDIDARQCGRSYSPTHAIVASAEDFLGGLAERLAVRDLAIRPVATTAGGRNRLGSSMLRTQQYGLKYHQIASATSAGVIAPQDAIHELQQIAPADTIFTVDSGDHFLFATHFLKLTYADQFLVMTGLGSMGQSIGAAIGAQLAHPGRFVTAICGDGCFAMAAFEIATAVAEQLPIRIFVFNDQRLGMVENGHQTVYGRRPSYPTNPMDVCTIARGLGATALKIDSIGQLTEHAELLRSHPGPVVIDVRIDPDRTMPRKDRIATVAPTAIRRPTTGRIPRVTTSRIPRISN